MTTSFKGLLKQCWLPQKQAIRWRTQVNIKKPTPRHFVRAQIEELVKPYYPKKIDPSTPLFELCYSARRIIKEEENPYEDLLAKDLYENWILKYKYIFFFHSNFMTEEESLDMQVEMKKCGLKIKEYERSTVSKSVTGTIYEPILILFQNHTLMGFGNKVKFNQLLKEVKKTKIVLMAGMFENRLLSVSEIQQYSTLPDIQTLRAQLVSVLNSIPGSIVQHLNHHPATLVQHLDQHVKISKKGEN